MIKEPKTISIDKLKPQSKNVKIHSKEQIDALAKIISNPKIGFNQPIVIDKKNNIWAGHGRLEAAKKLDMKEVPVVYLGDLTEDEKKAYMIMENRINESPWNKENLELILDEIKFDFKPYEMSFDDLVPPKIQEETQPIPEPPKEPKSKVGDIYQLGRHKVMCGDCTKNLDELIMGDNIQMIFTDPPYGMRLDADFTDMKGISGGNKYKQVEGDDKDYNPKHIFDSFPKCKEIFLWGADYYAERIPNRNTGCWMVWDKTEGGISPNSTYDKMFGSNFELCWSKVKHKRQIIRALWKGIFGLSSEDSKKRLHPTQKPTKLIRYFLELFSKENEIICDIFLGSGSTLIACEQTNRICYGMEIDPAYVDVIVKRWENFTGKKAKLLP